MHRIKPFDLRNVEIYNLSDINWEDETLENGIGDIDGSDPTMKGYNKEYEVDPYKSFSITGTTKYTLDVPVEIGDSKIDAGTEITVSCQTVCQTSLHNFVGCMQFDRVAFLDYMMSNDQNNYFNNSYLRNGNVIQSMNQNFYFTCTKTVVY